MTVERWINGIQRDSMGQFDPIEFIQLYRNLIISQLKLLIKSVAKNFNIRNILFELSFIYQCFELIRKHANCVDILKPFIFYPYIKIKIKNNKIKISLFFSFSDKNIFFIRCFLPISNSLKYGYFMELTSF